MTEFKMIDPADVPEPASLGIGKWTCRCGLLTIEPVKSSVTCVFVPTCPTCGDVGEVLPDAP